MREESFLKDKLLPVSTVVFLLIAAGTSQRLS